MANHPTAAQNTLDLLLSTGIQVLSLLVPDWEPPVLVHPHAVPYDSLVDFIDDIEPGDQVMVKATSGYYHHGIFVGKQNVGGTYRSAVVDFWGDEKENSAIGVRSLNDFVCGAVAFAKADYPHGMALERKLSARVALAWVESEKTKRTIYNVALNNCEVFATICRCGWCAGPCYDALTHNLMNLPDVPPALFHRGFK